MMNLMTAALLLAGAQDDELSGAAKKAAEMTSYTFKINTAGGPGKGRGGGTVEGKFEKDKPVWFKGAGTEAFRKEGALVYKEGEEWKKFERVKGAAKEQAGKKNAAPGVVLTAVKLPHEDLAEIDKSIKEAKKGDAKENDCTVFSGDLTDEAARRFGNPGTKGGGDLAYTGSAKVWVNAQGAIAKYELTIKAAGKVREKDVAYTTTRTVEVSEIGATKLEVPEAAQKLLGPAS